jgi:DNA-binding transcriptional LysR family regulator
MENSSFKSKRIFDVGRKLICSPSYYNAKPIPTHPGVLVKWDWITLKMLPNKRVFEFGNKTEEVIYKKSIIVNSVELMTKLSVNGLGLSTPPDFLVQEKIKNGELLEVLPEWHVPSIPVYAVWPENVNKNSNVLQFINHIVREL